MAPAGEQPGGGWPACAGGRADAAGLAGAANGQCIPWTPRWTRAGPPRRHGAAIGASRAPPSLPPAPRPLLADKSKAAKAAKAVKKSSFKNSRKPRYSVVFHRPKTLIRARDPKFPRVRCAGERGGAAGGAACSGMRRSGGRAGAGGRQVAGGVGKAGAGSSRAGLGMLAQCRESSRTVHQSTGRQRLGSISGVALTC